MTSPDIEIRWGNRDYPDDGIEGICDFEQRAMLRPKLERAIDIARLGLETFDVESTVPKRVVVHSLIPRKRDYACAEAVTARTIHLYLRNSAAGGHLDIGSYGLTLFHELLHCIRMEKIPILTVGEAAATEGISYTAGYMFYENAGAWKDERDFLLETVLKLPQKYLSGLRSELQSDINSPHWENELHAKWLTPLKIPKLLGVRKIDIAGIDAVVRQVNAGREIAELQTLPPHEVLGLERAA